MDNQKDIVSDSLFSFQDSAVLIEESPVFVFLETEENGNFSYREPADINRGLTPDWVLYFTIVALSILAWLKLIYLKFVVNLFRSSLDYQLSIKVFQDPGLIQKRIFVFLNFFYYLTAGVFIYLVLDYFNYNPLDLKDLRLLMAVTGLIIAYSLFRYLMMKLTGYLFKRQELFAKALFHNFIYNKILGIIIIPFILLIAYTRGFYQDISVYTGIFVFSVINIFRIVRLIKFLLKSVVLIFYFILYLCTLEIIPLLVIIKLVLSLS
ncbi:MAG: DUF4271 domain-containing protein [Bacteroidota bacterium]